MLRRSIKQIGVIGGSVYIGGNLIKSRCDCYPYKPREPHDNSVDDNLVLYKNIVSESDVNYAENKKDDKDNIKKELKYVSDKIIKVNNNKDLDNLEYIHNYIEHPDGWTYCFKKDNIRVLGKLTFKNRYVEDQSLLLKLYEMTQYGRDKKHYDKYGIYIYHLKNDNISVTPPFNGFASERKITIYDEDFMTSLYNGRVLNLNIFGKYVALIIPFDNNYYVILDEVSDEFELTKNMFLEIKRKYGSNSDEYNEAYKIFYSLCEKVYGTYVVYYTGFKESDVTSFSYSNNLIKNVKENTNKGYIKLIEILIK